MFAKVLQGSMTRHPNMNIHATVLDGALGPGAGLEMGAGLGRESGGGDGDRGMGGSEMSIQFI